MADYIRTNRRRLSILYVCAMILALFSIFSCVAAVWFFVNRGTHSTTPPSVPPLSDFVWVNQQDNNATENEVGIFLYSPIPLPDAENHFSASMLLQPLAASLPWSVQVKFSMQSNYQDDQQVFMLVLRNDTTQAAFSYGVSSAQGSVCYTWTSPTAPSPGLPVPGPVFTSITYSLWMRISCDGQNYSLASAISGYDWITWMSVPMNTTLESPSSVGFLLANDVFQPGSSAPVGVQVWSYSVTSL